MRLANRLSYSLENPPEGSTSRTARRLLPLTVTDCGAISFQQEQKSPLCTIEILEIQGKFDTFEIFRATADFMRGLMPAARAS